MDYKEAYNIIDHNSGSYLVTTANGTKLMRLFASAGENICQFAHAHADEDMVCPFHK